MNETWQRYLAEMLGTFVLVFVAAGSVLTNYLGGGSLGTVGVALATGFTLAAMVYATWYISGAHLNPAVTVAMWATGQTKLVPAVMYIVSQLVGAVVAALFIKVIYTTVSPQFFLGDAMLGNGVTPGMGILIEALLTFFLVWTFFATIMDKRAAPGFGALALGLVLAVGIMIGGNFTMGALNPARSFGPALLSSHWENHYVFWVGPVLGALVAGFSHHYLLRKR
ncbi:aquaporin [Candidatus Gracilibacteria bacterium]|nr:aquaporin [Candidatus Gracilibacteria bacterium]